MPSQKQMLALHRCHALKGAALAKAIVRIDTAIEAVANLTSGIGEFLDTIIQEALDDYMAYSIRYDTAISKRVQDELLEELRDQGTRLVDAFIADAIPGWLQKFTTECGFNSTTKTLDAIHQFALVRRDQIDRLTRVIDAQLLTCQPRTGFIQPLDLAPQRAAIRSKILKESERLGQPHEAALMGFVEGALRNCLVGILDVLTAQDFDCAGYGDVVMRSIAKASTAAFNAHVATYELLKRADFESGDDSSPTGTLRSAFQQICDKSARAVAFQLFESNAPRYVDLAYARFTNVFAMVDGSPREWGDVASSDIALWHREGIKEGLAAWDAIKATVGDSALFPLPSAVFAAYDFTLNRKLLDAKFAQAYADAITRHAQRNHSLWSSVPWPFWILLLILGWNELWAVIAFAVSNTLWLAVITGCVVGVGSYVWPTLDFGALGQLYALIRKFL